MIEDQNMNKKFLGIKIGTWISAVICLVIATLIWIYVEYDKALDSSSTETSQGCDES